MATVEEKLLKVQHDAWLASMAAERNKANVDYIAMMADVELPEEVSSNEPEV